MVKLEYGNSNNRKLVCENETINKALDEMKLFIEKIGYDPSFYKAILPSKKDINKEIWIYYGNLTNFFFINGFNENEYNQWFNNKGK